MNQNSYYGTPYAQPMGYPNYGVQQQAMPMYAQQPTKQPEYTNPLGAEKIKELMEKGNGGPKIALTEEDYYEAVCTHRHNGHLELVETADGKMRCKICGAEFIPTDNANLDDVKAATENLLNILHTAKVAWLDVPDKTAKEFFQAIAVIKKTPELFKIAMANFQQYNGYSIQNTNTPVNGFGVINQIFGGTPYPAQPYQQPYQQPVYQQAQYDPYGQPIQPMMGQPVYNQAAQAMQAGAPGYNPFGYANMQQPESQQAPVQQPQATQTQAAAQKGETVTKTLHV